MGKRQRDCHRCGAPVGLLDRALCWRCARSDRQAAAKQQCPGCGKQRVLDAATGRCRTCSRVCRTCGAVVRRRDATHCQSCRRKLAQEAGKSPCPRCGKPGIIRADTGWCGSCSRPGPPKLPPRTCQQCARLTNHPVRGLCSRCWQRLPDRPFVRAAHLADSLPVVPAWFDGFVVYLAGVYSPGRATTLVAELGRLLAEQPTAHPQSVLERARRPGRSMGTLARTLEDHFVRTGLALPTDQQTRLAAQRRHRRVAAVPDPLRQAVADWAQSQSAARQRALGAHTRPRKDSTIESGLGNVRDLAVFVHRRGPTDWAMVTRFDIEAFLATRNPGNRQRTVTSLRQFFRWAKTRRIILVDPTAGVRIPPRHGFTGPTLTVDQQRQVLRRWSAPDAHPHEALVGLLSLLHAASNSEIRHLRVGDVQHHRQAVQLGQRPQPTPLDPKTWTVLQRALQHREQLATANPHVIVTRGTKADSRPPSTAYVCHLLDPVGLSPKALRVTRLADMVNTLDPRMVAAAFGLTAQGAMEYLSDHVDPDRLLDEANRPRFGPT